MPDGGGVAYRHLLFDWHEVEVAPALRCARRLPGPRMRGRFDAKAWDEAMRLFGALRKDAGACGSLARLEVGAREAAGLRG